MRRAIYASLLTMTAMTALACSGESPDAGEARSESADGLTAAPGSVKESAPESATAPRERWCNSYKSERFCPTNVCVWFASAPTPYCGLPLEM